MAWSAQRRPAFFRSPYTTFLNTVRTTTIGKKKMHSPAFPVPVQLKRARAIKNILFEIKACEKFYRRHIVDIPRIKF